MIYEAWEVQLSKEEAYIEIDVGCHDLYFLEVPISSWLALKMQIWLLPYTWGQHCSLGVAIDNLYSLSSTEERYHAFAGC